MKTNSGTCTCMYYSQPCFKLSRTCTPIISQIIASVEGLCV